MNKLSFVNQTTFRIYTYRYKPVITPIAIILVCFILFFVIIIPQIQQWLVMQEQIAISEQRVEILTRNLTFANKINGNVIDKYLQLVTKALPSNKDFIGVLAAISNASIDSAISLNDYTFNVGDLSGALKDNKGDLQVIITINGGLSDLRRFAISLKKQLPLSDITDVRLEGSSIASLTLLFYYKPFPETISFQSSKPLQTLSPDEQLLLQQLVALDTASKKSALSIQERLIQR